MATDIEGQAINAVLACDVVVFPNNLDAIRRVRLAAQKLEKLDDGARQRVLRYVADRRKEGGSGHG